MRDWSDFPLLPPPVRRLAATLKLGAALPLAAIVSVGAVSVAGCSSGGSPSGGSGPTATKTAKAAATPADTISPPPGAEVTSPGTVQMGKFTEIFDGSLPSDAADAAVASDFRQAMVLWDSSQENLTEVAPVESYVTGPALTDLITTIKNFSRNNYVPSGTDRLFKTAVTGVTSSSATVTSCDDASKFTEVNPKTGAENPSFKNVSLDDQYVFITWTMEPLNGHWVVLSVKTSTPPTANAEQCLPS